MTTTEPMPGHPLRGAVPHALALTGPIVPAVLFATWRRADRFASREAAKAAMFSLAMVALFALGTAVRIFVPLVGFLGTLTQWVVPLVSVYFCLAGFRLALQGQPATYPIQFKVVKTDD